MIETPEMKKMSIEDIKPYEKNPRILTDESVDAVADSIRRFGYQQPIVVDGDGVIVVGHTRFEAMKKLGYKKIEVYVTQLDKEKSKEYRLIDNRTSEMSTWDFDSLVLELREFEDDLLDSYFPDVDLEIGLVNDSLDVTDADMDKAAKKVTTVRVNELEDIHMTGVECPSCFHEFNVKTTSLPGLSEAEFGELINGETQ